MKLSTALILLSACLVWATACKNDPPPPPAPTVRSTSQIQPVVAPSQKTPLTPTPPQRVFPKEPTDLTPSETKAVAEFKRFFQARQNGDTKTLLSLSAPDARWMEHKHVEASRKTDENAFLEAVQKTPFSALKLFTEDVLSSANGKLVIVQFLIVHPEGTKPDQRGFSIWTQSDKGAWSLARHMQYAHTPDNMNEQKPTYTNLPKYDPSTHPVAAQREIAKAVHDTVNTHTDIFNTLDDKVYADTITDDYIILAPGQLDRNKNGVLSLMRTLRQQSAVIQSKGDFTEMIIEDDVAVPFSINTVSIRTPGRAISATMRSLSVYRLQGGKWVAQRGMSYSYNPPSKP